MEEYNTLWEVIKFLLQNLLPVKKIMDIFSLKNLYIQIGGIIGFIGCSLLLIDKIRKKFK